MNDVLFYSGIQIDETPRTIIKNGKKIDVFLIEEKLIEDFVSGKREVIFIVSDKNGNIYKIRREK